MPYTIGSKLQSIVQNTALINEIFLNDNLTINCPLNKLCFKLQ
jgi:hypothetical protein